MKAFVAKVPTDVADLFQRFCERMGTTPYAVLGDHIRSLVTTGDQEATAPVEPLDFSLLVGVTFPNVESALLAQELIGVRTMDELPDWLRDVVQDRLTRNPAWDAPKLVRKLQHQPALLRQLIVVEVESAAKEQGTQVTERPTSPADLAPAAAASPAYTDQEAAQLLAGLADEL